MIPLSSLSAETWSSFPCSTGNCPYQSPFGTGWLDGASFRLLGDCLLWALIWKFPSSAIFWAAFFPRYQLRINFDKKLVLPHFWRLFQERIWSPCFGTWSRLIKQKFYSRISKASFVQLVIWLLNIFIILCRQISLGRTSQVAEQSFVFKDRALDLY
jgi:hypothetical protein